jgi:hypothetical protein
MALPGKVTVAGDVPVGDGALHVLKFAALQKGAIKWDLGHQSIPRTLGGKQQGTARRKGNAFFNHPAFQRHDGAQQPTQQSPHAKLGRRIEIPG